MPVSTENIDFSGKNIVVGSWFLDDGDPSHISLTIIDGGAWGSVVSFSNGEDNAIVTGFTIQNGFNLLLNCSFKESDEMFLFVLFPCPSR